jgi:hypothetical protein
MTLRHSARGISARRRIMVLAVATAGFALLAGPVTATGPALAAPRPAAARSCACWPLSAV